MAFTSDAAYEARQKRKKLWQKIIVVSLALLVVVSGMAGAIDSMLVSQRAEEAEQQAFEQMLENSATYNVDAVEVEAGEGVTSENDSAGDGASDASGQE